MRYIFSFILSLVTFNSFAQQVSYEVYAIEFARIQGKIPVWEIAIKPPTKDSVRVCFMIWLLRGTNGRNILLDAGFHKPASDPTITSYTQPDVALQKMNIKPG